jgi:hypothetical protein
VGFVCNVVKLVYILLLINTRGYRVFIYWFRKHIIVFKSNECEEAKIKRSEGLLLKFIKQNFLTLIVLIILVVNFNMLNNLLVKYNDLSSRYFMLENSILNQPNYSNQIQQQSPPQETKDVMSPLELAKYMDIEMMQVYDMVEKDSTMPFIQINGE